MADEVSDQVEDALNLIVSTTEQSGNMKKGLKQTIFETVSTLRNLFAKLRDIRNIKTREISKLEMQVTKLKAELEECSSNDAKVHGMPCLIHCQEAADTMAKEHGAPHYLSFLGCKQHKSIKFTKHLISHEDSYIETNTTQNIHCT